MAPDIIQRLKASALALSTALTIYPCQIRVHQTLTVLNSNFLELGRSGGQPQRIVNPRRLPANYDTHYVSNHRTHSLPIASPTHYQYRATETTFS